jgi:hypothetical protein
MSISLFLYFTLHFILFFLETGSHYAAQAVLRFAILLLQPPRCCDLQTSATMLSIAFFFFFLGLVYITIKVKSKNKYFYGSVL